MTEQKPAFKDPEKQDFKTIFLLLGALLLAVLVWELYEEARGRQPWIGYQEEFKALELDELNKQLTSAKTTYEDKQKKLAFAPVQAEPTNADQYQKRLAEAEALLHSSEYRQASAQTNELKQKFEEAKIQHQFMKADLDAIYYRFDLAKEEGKDNTKIGEELSAMKSKLKDNEDETASLENQLASVSAKVIRYESDLAAIKKQMDSQTADIVSIEERIEKIKARPATISQIVVSGLGEYQKVDRCVTCHAGIDRKDFENAPKLVFRAHPDHDKLFRHHPVEKIGCTACHDGQGRALTAKEAHEGEEHWIAPMLEAKYVPSTCGRCHSNAPLLTEAATVAQGAHVFQEKGCIACHKVDGSPYLLAEPARIGPELLKVKNKVKSNWLVTWIKNPKAIHPRTYMPHFGQKNIGLPDNEAKAIASYLVLNSLPFQPSTNALAYQSSHVATDSSVKAGEKLFNERGCMGCHELGSYRALGPRHIALDGVANKLSKSWIYSWVEDPKHYSDTTIMPKFPLAKEEVANLTDFLSTLTKPETDVKYLTVSTNELSSTTNFLTGKKLVKKYGCYSCHKIPGYENLIERIGPELTDFAAKDPHMLFWGNKNIVPVKERNWYSWTEARLKEPKAFETDRVEAIMPNLNLSNEERDKIMLFLRTLSSQKTVVKELRRELM
ncbi:MAG: c-type cytochrome, partial [Candidatus Melainabacteria bacterium]|nr:c-type cytochrome [Candidatus Melainabacteria bacterium]